MTILPRGVGFATGRVNYAGAVSLRFGQLVIAFRAKDGVTAFNIDETHAPFVVPTETPADLELTCSVAALDVPEGPVTASGASSWDLRRDAEGGEDIVFRGGPNYGTDVWHLRLDPSFRTGTLTEAPLMPNRAIRADGYPLLEYVVARLLARHDGALIHASTAIVDGRAYVFVGHSRAGKSTMAAIAEAAGAQIPTDDRTILTIRDGRPMAWGTPWHGSLIRKTPDGAPIEKFYLLQQAQIDRKEPLSQAHAVKELFVRLIQPRLHGMEVQRTLEILERIAQKVPMARLHFRPTPAAFDLAVGGE